MSKIRKEPNAQDGELVVADVAPSLETPGPVVAETLPDAVVDDGLLTLYRDEETATVSPTNWRTNRHIWENAGWRLPAQE